VVGNGYGNGYVQSESGGQDEPAEVTLVAGVKYYPGRTTFSARPSRLEWSPADRISLVVVDNKTGADVETIFDVSSAEVRVKPLRGAIAIYVLTIAGRKYKLDFASGANIAIGVGGLGRRMASRMIRKSDLPSWVEAFDGAGLMS
jgi:hypothetical protein